MRHTLRLLLTISALFVAGAAFAACEGQLPAKAQQAINASNPDLANFSTSVRYYMNIERCKRGITPFSADTRLMKAATVHSNYMAGARSLTHNSNVQGYRNLNERMHSANVTMHTAGENIGQNFLFVLGGKEISTFTRGKCKFTYTNSVTDVPQHSYGSLAHELVQSWLASAQHRKNMLNRQFTRMEASFGFAQDDTTCGYIFASQNFAG
ncbi:MAG: CAP domain-containing protein [Paracoccaceae bacterium]|jgi:uncharacterized protein YkwD